MSHFAGGFNQKLASISDSFCVLTPVDINSEIGGIQYLDYTEDVKLSEEITDVFRKQMTAVVLFDRNIYTESKQKIRQIVHEKNSSEKRRQQS